MATATARFSATTGDGAVRAIVEDDGRGFDPGTAGKAEQRLGLYGIRERAELLGGKLTIESEPGRGASLFVEIPLFDNTGLNKSDNHRDTERAECSFSPPTRGRLAR